MNEHLTTDLLIDYAHGELRAEDDAFVHAHLAGCGRCREELDAEVTLTEALRDEGERTERELPGAVRGAIWAAVDAERRPAGARLAAFFRPIVALPVAAVAIALVVISTPFGHGGSGTRVDAAYYFEAHAAQQAENPFSDRPSTATMDTAMLDDTTPPAEAVKNAPGDDVLADVSLSSGLDVVR